MPTDQVQAALARFRHRRHDVILTQVLDREEMRFNIDEPAPFVGLEGESKITVDPRTVRESYLSAVREHCSKIEHSARSLGYDYLRVDSHESVGPPLAALFARRVAMGRGGKGGGR